MLLGKLRERKDKTALKAYMHRPLQSYSTVRNAKINLQNNTHNVTSTIHSTLSFYLRETYRICNFLANFCDTPVHNTKHQFPCHMKFKKHRVKRDLG